jgi:hypothetical protein
MWAPSLAALVALTGAPQDSVPDPEAVAAAVEDLEAAFRSGVKDEKVRALDRASDVVAPAVIDEITRGFKDREREVQAATIQALRWMDHPAALKALHKTAKKSRTIKKDEELYPAILKAVGQHGDPDSVHLLSHKPFDSPFYQAGRARVLGLGRIRTAASLEALFGMLRSSSANEVERHMKSFRLSLMVLTGTDQGPSAQQWLRWWKANKKGFEISPTRRELPRPIARSWTEYWGIDNDYGRTRRREDRGD